ncbi:MAG: capsule assembly Wzi family protein [Bacteroidales bacterium]
MSRTFLIVSILLITTGIAASAQPTAEHLSHRGIYDYLDEMASEQLIELNTTIKPYTRDLILDKLQHIEKQQEKLNARQRKELNFYLRDFSLSDSTDSKPLSGDSGLDIFGKNDHFATGINPVGFFYKNETFSFGFRPIWGIEYLSNANGSFSRTWGFGRIYGKVGEHFGFYASLRDNHMSDVLARPDHFTRRDAGVYKGNSIGGADYSEMRGGITYGWNWGEVTLAKDHIEWGDNYKGALIRSGRTPSIGMAKLHLKPARWFEFNYYHGWLVSEVVDSLKSYTPASGFERPVYKPKYMAANMFTVIPTPNIHFSFGNSIIYGDIPVQAGYLVPFMFFKSIDHTINAHIENQNSQMYANLSIRSIKHLHLYGSLFIDEFAFFRVGDPNKHNFYSYKAGAKLSNWPIRNASLTFETSRSRPITYKHRIPLLTYETNRFNMGHYMRDNSKDFYAELDINPLPRFHFKASYLYAAHGNEYDYARTEEGDFILDELEFMKEKTWDKEKISFQADFEFSNNAYIFAGYTLRNIQGYKADGKTADHYLSKFTPELLHGETNTFRFGFNVGF